MNSEAIDSSNAPFLNGAGVFIPSATVDIPIERIFEELGKEKELRLNVLRVLAGAMMVRRISVEEVKTNIEMINNSISKSTSQRKQ